MSDISNISKVKVVEGKKKANRLLKKGWIFLSKERVENKFWCSGNGWDSFYYNVTEYTLGKPKKHRK